MSASDGDTTARLKVRGFDLEVGASAGSSVSPAPGAAPAPDPELGRALAEVEDALVAEEATLGTAVTAGLDKVDEVTSQVERATELFEMFAKDATLDPTQFRPEIDWLLDRLAEHDDSGRLAEALRLARALEKLLALIERWQALGKSLTTALRAARVLKDKRSVAWVQHELGTLQLAAGDPVAADRNLSAARDLRRQLEDHAGLRVTEGNLQSLCQELRQELEDGRLRRVQGRGIGRGLALPVAAAVALLMAGGVAGAVISGGDDSSGGGDGPVQTDGTGTTAPANEHELKVDVSPGGSVRSRRGDIACPKGPCSAHFEEGASVALVATEAEGFEFERWGGDCTPAPAPVCELILSRDRAVSASFVERGPATATLTVTVTAENLSVGSDPGGIACPEACILTQPLGTPVSLVAIRTSHTSPRQLFAWGGDCGGTPGDTDTCGLVLDGDKEVSVGYQPLPPPPPPTTTTSPPPTTTPLR